MLYDAHCHLHELDVEELLELKGYVIAAVSDDLESSLRTLDIAEEHRNVVPCVGVHPWSIGEASMSHLRELEKLVERAKCIGEVGLDRRFVPETYSKQLEFFKFFVKLARDYDLPMNIHAPDAWRDVYDILVRYDVERAVIHWYTGPLDLLDEIAEKGYFISINPAAQVQEKHMRVAVQVKLSSMLVESDAPYKYRGLSLTPKLIPKLLSLIAEARRMSLSELTAIVERNFKRLFRSP